ncbi:MAG: DUF805 domain-containing protein [Rikenellaceae bacterium]
MNYFLDAIRKYVDFNGTLNVRGFWMFILLYFVFGLILVFIPFLNYLYGLFLFIPTIAATIRRLRDAGKDPLWILIGFVPLIGTIWLIVLLCQPSK